MTHGAPKLLHQEVGFTGEAIAERIEAAVLDPRLAGRRLSRPVAKVRLDSLLAERGLFESRSRAAAAVIAGEVHVASRLASKPSQLVDPGVDVVVAAAPAYVSRGREARQRARRARRAGRGACLDVGASTGGFTDCLLQRGAERVVALDVAYGELDYRLRRGFPGDRDRAHERALDLRRSLTALPDRDRRLVHLADEGAARRAGAGGAEFDCLAMVKPQFEVGRERVGKGGVVRDPELRREAVAVRGRVRAALGCSVLGFAPSGLPGRRATSRRSRGSPRARAARRTGAALAEVAV